jgi:hypothetical protein
LGESDSSDFCAGKCKSFEKIEKGISPATWSVTERFWGTSWMGGCKKVPVKKVHKMATQMQTCIMGVTAISRKYTQWHSDSEAVSMTYPFPFMYCSENCNENEDTSNRTSTGKWQGITERMQNSYPHLFVFVGFLWVKFTYCWALCAPTM